MSSSEGNSKHLMHDVRIRLNGESEATVVRTAGGRVHAAMSTLLVLSAVGNLGKKGVIMVVHHTDCGLQTANDEDIRKVLGEGIGAEGREVLKGAVFGSFVRPEESVKEDVEVLKASPFFKGMQILGFVQDTKTGLLTEVGALE
jgi:carbonic anhydrase